MKTIKCASLALALVGLLGIRAIAADTPDAWLEGAKQHEGSWWVNWRAWLNPHAGAAVPARIPGKGKLKVIEAAPGTYARIRADAK